MGTMTTELKAAWTAYIGGRTDREKGLITDTA
jgi:hypothetical protein